MRVETLVFNWQYLQVLHVSAFCLRNNREVFKNNDAFCAYEGELVRIKFLSRLFYAVFPFHNVLCILYRAAFECTEKSQ